MGNMKILNTNTAIYTIELHEAKVVPFKKLEQAWTRTNGDKAKQAKLIKKYDLKTLISKVRPGSIKLGVMNKLNHVNGNATAAGTDLDGELIFITNNPLKIIYPKKSSRRPEGEEIEEADDGAIVEEKVEEKKSLSTLRLEKVASLAIKEDDQGLIEAFVKTETFSIDSTPSKIKEAYKMFESSAKWIIYDKKTGKQLSPSKSWRKWQGAKMAAAKIGGNAEPTDAAWYHDNKAKLMGEATDLEEDYQKVLDAMLKNGSNKKEAEALLKKHYPYVDKAYRSSSASKKAEIIVSLAASESTDLNEVSAGQLALLDTQQLMTFYTIFSRVSSPRGKEMTQKLKRELSKRDDFNESTDLDEEITLKDVIRGGTRIARALKKSASVAKVFLKATIAVSKKVGGAIGELMSDPEFQAIFKKYSEDPTDERSLKRAQMYLDPKFGDSQSPHFSEAAELEEMSEGQTGNVIATAAAAFAANAVKNTVKSRLTRSGRAERLTKKADSADKKAEDLAKIKRAKERLKAQKAKAKEEKEKAQARKAKERESKQQESTDLEEAATWKSEGHYTADGKEWTGDQHEVDGQVMTGKVHSDDSVDLYHFKELTPEVRKQVAASFE